MLLRRNNNVNVKRKFNGKVVLVLGQCLQDSYYCCFWWESSWKSACLALLFTGLSGQFIE